MDLKELKKQYLDDSSNYYFLRQQLVLDYIRATVEDFGFTQALAGKVLKDEEKFYYVEKYKLILKTATSDLQHAKHLALSIIDKFGSKLRDELNFKTVSGTSNGIVFLYLISSHHLEFLRFKFTKKDNRIEVFASISFGPKLQEFFANSSFVFLPYLISVFPIQTNSKEVLDYGSKIIKILSSKYRLLADLTQVDHLTKLAISKNIKIPFSISYGTKDTKGEMINLYKNLSNEYHRISLKELNKFLIGTNSSYNKTVLEPIFVCKSKSCLKEATKNKKYLKPFDQIVISKKCNICSNDASLKIFVLKAGEN
jgi:hypothetical protein